MLAAGRLASSWSGQHDAAAVSPSLLSWTHRTGGVLVATTSAPRYMFSVCPSSRLVCLSLCHLPTYLSGARAGILFLLLLLCTAGEYYFDATLQPVGYVGDGGGSNGCAVHCREAWQRGGTGAMRAGLITMSCNVARKGLDVFSLFVPAECRPACVRVYYNTAQQFCARQLVHRPGSTTFLVYLGAFSFLSRSWLVGWLLRLEGAPSFSLPCSGLIPREADSGLLRPLVAVRIVFLGVGSLFGTRAPHLLVVY